MQRVFGEVPEYTDVRECAMDGDTNVAHMDGTPFPASAVRARASAGDPLRETPRIELATRESSIRCSEA